MFAFKEKRVAGTRDSVAWNAFFPNDITEALAIPAGFRTFELFKVNPAAAFGFCFFFRPGNFRTWLKRSSPRAWEAGEKRRIPR